MRYAVKVPPFDRLVRAEAARFVRDRQEAVRIATDRRSRAAQKRVQARMQAVGLGRLAGAVGQTSTLKQTRSRGANAHVVAYRSRGNAYGVIYARGGDESLAGGALESYTRGTTIRASQKQWLAFQTKALPRRVGKYRMTPERYRTSGLAATLGPLRFRPISPRLAVLEIVRPVGVNVRTGRAKLPGKRPSRVNPVQKRVVAFILIRETARAKRFDKDVEIGAEAAKLPDDIAEALEEIQRRRG